MKGFILLLLAFLLFIVFAPFGILWQMIRNLKKINEYFFKIAICLDQAGNVVCCKILDDVMTKKNGYKFGNEDETVSSVIGKNKERRTLSFIGYGLYHLLDSIQKNHAEKAIEINETDDNNIK